MSDGRIPKDKLIQMYTTMVKIRQFEDRVYLLFLQGEMPGTIHLSQGQEAVAAGVCANLRKEDLITSTHRPHGHAIAKGVSIKSLMAELFARKTGCCEAKGGSMHVGDMDVGMLPAIAIVGGGIPVATGLALGCKMMRTDKVVVSFFGDGASNTGAFHEGINMGAIWDLPIVYVCENNLYGASTHISKVMKIKNVADRAASYGIPGMVVDGNDVFSVYNAAKEAVSRAREGKGPTLLECKTYRRGGHSRSDSHRYRPKEEEEVWLAKDPIPRAKDKLMKMGVLTVKKVKEIEDRTKREITEAIEYAQKSPFPKPEDTLLNVFT
ncbi:pyruvate dehydrogenase (acetyl-transferring) E1 component subunit alpha [Candidatus Aerophobetes bacterium]|uniref:Pyruvate dehydrogenase (Acetyl-transferring) E1 component subunit alpha n=1 Tax=Aerophobetes bacterium TaxID=2030807 RepID=A0A662D2T1_UNCAE|nr:MAG: pyruvate dehydrogenase (acetyl-transferring) E1 component subunit alpha [Candidatus Aerophobetes bacterium]